MSLTVRRVATGRDPLQQMAADVRAGLLATPKSLPPKYFYDAAGSALFERITHLPEYYQTRAETGILRRVAADVVAAVGPHELVELGAGSARKTLALIEALRAVGSGNRYVPLDVSEDALIAGAEALLHAHPWLEIEAVVADFERDLAHLPREGRRMIAFLGSTIGNLDEDGQQRFLCAVAAALCSDDALLLGLDLVKDPDVLQRAYDDDAGVTAAFNRNVLRVVNAGLGADFEPERFAHVARWVPAANRVEMWLRATTGQTVTVKALDLQVGFAAGEEMLTELSCKFTRALAAERLERAGLRLCRWDTDKAQRFAVALARPA